MVFGVVVVVAVAAAVVVGNCAESFDLEAIAEVAVVVHWRFDWVFLIVAESALMKNVVVESFGSSIVAFAGYHCD